MNLRHGEHTGQFVAHYSSSVSSTELTNLSEDETDETKRRAEVSRLPADRRTARRVCAFARRRLGQGRARHRRPHRRRALDADDAEGGRQTPERRSILPTKL